MMVEIYNKEYFENYKLASKQVNYKDSSEVKELFHKIAKKIVDDLNPKTVLDVGCATGHLVSALRNLGVDAYGIDVSEYAISNVDDDIKPYCYVSSIAEDIPKELLKKYDLVFCNQVLEYIYDEDLKKAVGNISSLSDTVLFGKSNSALQDTLLLSVRHMEYWSKIFAEFNLFNMLDYLVDFDVFSITMFYKTDRIPRVIENYERHLRVIKKQKQDMQTDLEF
ncbi:MAG: class I SAM-dependent methyltransferase, partial [Oscillospiraceae bacterium]|nr:class I SAM-dependent methyltransferase [Oscillospiraceae bacterium]